MDHTDQRLAVHAALADPIRLGIVDALSMADHSPSILASTFDISSNLLAHHLGTLERTGVVRRQRSEGDGRRSYVTLQWDNPIVAASVRPTAPLVTPRVVFVCTYNSARSQIAASLLEWRSDVPVASAGTDPAPAIHPCARAALRRRGLSAPAATPQHIDSVVQPSDMVISVCDRAFEDLNAAGAPMMHWSIPDPARTQDPTVFDHTLDVLDTRVKHLVASLTPGA